MSLEEPSEGLPIHTAIRDYILGAFLPSEDPSALADSTPLITSGILDSIDVMKLVAHLEASFDITFNSQDVSIENLDTLRRIVSVVNMKTMG